MQRTGVRQIFRAGALLIGLALMSTVQPSRAEGDEALLNPLVLVQQAQLRQMAQTRPGTSEPSTPRRTERIVYDSWAVTCEEDPSAKVKKSCLAGMRIAGQNRQQVLLNWQIGYNNEGRYVTAVHVPASMSITKNNETVGGGLLLANGVELKFGNGPVRRLNYLNCSPQECLAETAIDDAFIKDALASTTATLTVQITGGGGAVPFEVPTKGIDKAISSTRTR